MSLHLSELDAMRRDIMAALERRSGGGVGAPAAADRGGAGGATAAYPAAELPGNPGADASAHTERPETVSGGGLCHPW